MSPPSIPAAFDRQARDFDARAGLAPAVQRAVARAVLALREHATALTVLDVGAGTGDIGLELVRSGARYVGLDESAAMLEVFRLRAAAEGLNPRLVVGDARERWPLADGSAGAVFGSRSLHWLDPSHAAGEARRVLAPGGLLLVGRVERDAEGPPERMRQKMRELLRLAGYEGRPGRRILRDLVLECRRLGASELEPRTVAEWTVSRSPGAKLAGWTGKAGLAGRDVPEDVQRTVLAELARWTEQTIGNIDVPLPSAERYVLAGAVFLP